MGFNGAQILRNCCRFYAAALDQYRFKAIFGSLDMSENQIVNHLRAIESQPSAAEAKSETPRERERERERENSLN